MRIIAYVTIMLVLLLVQSTLISFIQVWEQNRICQWFALCMSMIRGEKIGAVTGFLMVFLKIYYLEGLLD